VPRFVSLIHRDNDATTKHDGNAPPAPEWLEPRRLSVPKAVLLRPCNTIPFVRRCQASQPYRKLMELTKPPWYMSYSVTQAAPSGVIASDANRRSWIHYLDTNGKKCGHKRWKFEQVRSACIEVLHLLWNLRSHKHSFSLSKNSKQQFPSMHRNSPGFDTSHLAFGNKIFARGSM
jgi:hypothetical protein